MDDRTGSQEDLVFAGVPGSGSWSDWRSWSRRQKLFVGSSIVFSVAILTAIIIVVATYSTSSTVIPTPSPVTTSTPPTSTTSQTTTTQPTPPTTTTQTTTTTSTTPKTTTTSTPPPTTTSTTPPPTTTSPTPPTTNSTTTQAPGPYHPSTKKPFPSGNWTQKPPLNLLNEEGIETKEAEIDCKTNIPPVFRAGYLIPSLNHTWLADGLTKKEARWSAAMHAVEDIFVVKYPQGIPVPQFNCTPVSA